MKKFRKGGVHPPENKLSAGVPIVNVELPRKAVVLMQQHLGAPATPVVKKGDAVERGQIVGTASGFISANVHSPITGTVTKVDKALTPGGYGVDAVYIEATDEQHAADEAARRALVSSAPTAALMNRADELPIAAADYPKLLADKGIVGLGGATFPTNVKVAIPTGKEADVLVVNGAECEPYLTNDDALMRVRAAEIAVGTRMLMRAIGARRAAIGIENNKPEAIAALSSAVAELGDKAVTVEPLRVRYPQGGEKQLIEAVTGRRVPSGELPIAVGAVVVNVATIFAIYEALIEGEPLTERVVTVTGPSVKSPGNFRVAIGTPVSQLIELAGGLPDDTAKVIFGGPMMGRAAVTIDTPVVKGTSGILILPAGDAERDQVEPCIRCARCVDVCPMGLEPYLISTLSRLGRYEDAEKEAITDCIECGSCSYTCPSRRPLLDFIRLGKAHVMAAIKARRAAEKK